MSKKNRKSLQIPKYILILSKILEYTSKKLAAKFAMKLFTTPTKFKIPKRELAMDKLSTQQDLIIPSINKQIRVYQIGNMNKKILLVHGWSGRGTQLWSIAEKLLKNGYSIISFDAPAHGKSAGKTSDMTEFVAAIHELEKQYGSFHTIIGHSLGAMATLNAVKNGVKTGKIITIGSGDIIQDIVNEFIKKLGMTIATAKEMTKLFEKKFNATINSYSAYIAAKEITVPTLVIHDSDDKDVPVNTSKHIHKHLKNGQLLITDNLGHRKILGDKNVINNILNFIE